MLHSGPNHNFIVGLWLALVMLVLGSQSSPLLGYWQDPEVASGFRWCLKHKLFEHAESQLNIVMNSDVSAAELDSLSRQLSVLRASQERQKQRELAEALKAKQLAVVEPKLSQRSPESLQGQLVVDDSVANLKVDGMVQQVSYAAPVKQTSGANRPAKSTQTSSSESSFSKVAAIPDLKRSHRLGAVAPVVVDPYDASRFNAETVRRNGLK